MSIISCPECNHQVSSQAYSCPGCGYPFKKPNKSGIGAALGCLLAILVLPVVIAIIGLLAAIGIPSFQKARNVSIEKSCQNNLCMIEAAKDRYALEQGLAGGATVTEECVGVYIKGGFNSLQCMKQGVYEMNPIGVPPECSVHDASE